MRTRVTRKVKKVVFGIQEQQCIWMRAGIVDFKLCHNVYDCMSCSFDKAMQRALKEDGGLNSWRKEMLDKFPEKQCRHMLTGNVNVRACSYAYACARCEFDQELYERQLVEFPGVIRMLKISGFNLAVDYLYHPGHSWARMEYGGFVRVGMDDFAWKLVGFPDEISLPEIGAQVIASGKGWVLRRGDKTSPVMSPVSGKVVARNYKVIFDPGIAKDDPYGEGWLLMIEPENLPSVSERLMHYEDAENWLKMEAARLDQLVDEIYEVAIAATGGERSEDIYGNMRSIGWDRVVEKFLIRK
ncbi:MAG: glycine cleavage system protein H [Syntrophobacterales bacterium]|nr:glycine cleavage system protein H [Syntrophobacterales bacterium]